MSAPVSLYKDLEFRGILKQVTDPALEKALDEGKLTLYCGFDPTSDSLHVGSLLPLITLKRFQLAGHRPLAVVGGATGMIGDPSGKSSERNLQTEEILEYNLRGIRGVIEKFLTFDGPNAARVVNNADWFRDMGFLRFLRDVGKHFTVNHMMAKESVRARLEDREHGISYTEFSYMLLQAYDFLVLHDRENCRLQIGGSDQWGNITAGIELIRRMGFARRNEGSETPIADEAPAHVFGLTHPLVTKSDGAKFGKSEKGNLWLDPQKTSPYQFYQFFIQTADADVGTFLRFFTFLSHEEILALEASVKSAPEKRQAQIRLAQELTRLVHGDEELKRAEGATQALFTESLDGVDEKSLLEMMSGAPNLAKTKDSLSPGLPLVDLLVETGLCTSKGMARKEIQGGGIYVNNARATDAALTLTTGSLVAGGYVVLRRGKKTYHLVSFK